MRSWSLAAVLLLLAAVVSANTIDSSVHQEESSESPAGLYVDGNLGEFGPVKVLLNDGVANYENTVMLKPEDCAETFMEYRISNLNANVLKADDVVVTNQVIDKSEEADLSGPCTQSTMNFTLEFTFNEMPGETMFTLTVVTDKDGTSKEYDLTGSFRVAGMAIYETTSDDEVRIVSGEGRAVELGTYEDIMDQRLKSYKVAVQSSDFSEVDASNIELSVVDPVTEEWQEYIAFSSSCPAAEVTMGSDGMANFEQGCHVGFDREVNSFHLKMNPYRVGCGGFCVVVKWSDLNVDEVEFTTKVCFEIDTSKTPPVVLKCSENPMDSYGFEQYPYQAYNLVMCDNSLRPSDNVELSMRFGDAAFETFTMRLQSVDQVLALATKPFEETGANDRNVGSTTGTARFAQEDGTVIESDVKVWCDERDSEGEIMANFQKPDLAIIADDAAIKGQSQDTEDTTLIDSHIELPYVMQLSDFRLGHILSQMPVDNGMLVDTKAVYTNSASRSLKNCDGAMCTLRNVASRVGGLVSQRLEDAESEDGTFETRFVSIRAAVRVDQFDDLKKQILALDGDETFAARTNQLSIKVNYVGPPADLDDSPQGDGSAIGAGTAPVLIAVIVAGIVGLLLLILAIIYVVVADRDENTTESDWSEGGVSVEGVPVPSSRYYDAVVVDNYGRGDGPRGELRPEQPMSAAEPRS